MKKIFYTILAAAAMFTSCNNEIIVHDGKGMLDLDLACKADYKDLITKAPQTEEELLNSLVIDILRSNGEPARPSTTYGELRGRAIELGSGLYNITASSPEKNDVAFDQPIFEGSSEFEIKIGQVTQTDIVCKIKNAKVTILLTEGFHTELSAFTITVSNGAGSLAWMKTSQTNDFMPAEDSGNTVYRGIRSGYFSVAPLTVHVKGQRPDGSVAETTRKINTVNAADHHIIKLDADITGSLGGINITISDKVNNIEDPIIVGGFEEIPVEGDRPAEGEGDGEEEGGNETPVEPSTAPTLVWENNPTYADVDLPMSMSATVSVELEIRAPKGIRDFLIYVKSPVLTSTIAGMTDAGTEGVVDGVATMDMINDEKLYKTLGNTLPMKEKVQNQTSVPFSLSNLVPMINMYVGKITPGDKHTFTLHVVDNEGQLLEQTVTFVSVAVEPASAE